MNNYDDEATRYQNPDDEATQLEDTTSEQNNDETNTPSTTGEAEVKSAAKGSTWKRAAVGAGSGLLIGGITSVLMGMKNPDTDNNDGTPDDDNHREDLSNPEWVDDEIAVATSVNDDMSFGEAFAAARAEVGAGGCFEWHGNLYSTYTAEEWNSMTAEERADWSDHFSWKHIDHSQSDVAQHSTTAQDTPSDDQAAATVTATATDDADIEVVSVNHDENDIAQNQLQNNVHQTSTEVEVQSAEPEIEILGAVHDNETDTNIGSMTVDGQDVILIDVDNDLAFDYMAADTNGNGQIDPGEVIDIQGQNLTVHDLGGFSNPTCDLYADNEGPDYSSDGDVYEG